MRQLVDGPRGHFLLGNLPEARRDNLGFYSRIWREKGDFVRLRGGPFQWYFIAHPNEIEQVFQTQHHNFTKGALVRPMKLAVGEGLFTSEGATWLKQRRLMQPAFHRQRIESFGAMMASAADNLAQAWREKARDGNVFDVVPEMSRLTLEIAGRALFNIDLSSESSTVARALPETMNYIYSRLVNPLSSPVWLPTASARKFRRSLKALDDVVYKIIREHNGDESVGDLLCLLLAARDEGSHQGMTTMQLRDEVLTLLAAGHETTAVALSWALYLLGRYPEIAEKLREELDGKLSGRLPGIADLPNLKYTRMVVEETLRLYPPAWGGGRETATEVRLGNATIPPKKLVFFVAYLTHRHPDFWPEPEKFLPERFDPLQNASRPRYAYFPFGGGPRLCIGREFAMQELQIVLAILLSRFEIELVSQKPVDVEAQLSLRPRGGVFVKLRERK
jgi:cytochrome P450